MTVIPGLQVITGASTSFTVTVKEQVELLPEPSVAVTVTVLVPDGNAYGDVIGVAPILYEIVTDPGQLSVADAAKLLVAVHTPGSLLVVILDGQLVIVGAVPSTTVTVNVQFVVWPLEDAIHVTVVVPTGKKLFGASDPGARLRLKLLIQLSVACGTE